MHDHILIWSAAERPVRWAARTSGIFATVATTLGVAMLPVATYPLEP